MKNIAQENHGKEVIYIPQVTKPSKWSSRDKRAVSDAVAVGIFKGLLVWTLFLMVLGALLYVSLYVIPFVGEVV